MWGLMKAMTEMKRLHRTKDDTEQLYWVSPECELTHCLIVQTFRAYEGNSVLVYGFKSHSG